MTKPHYKIPSMAEIDAVPWNGRKVVSTFSGGGGSALGYRWAGFKVIWANEFEENPCRTYQLNHPQAVLNNRDIKTVTADEILFTTGLKVGELDVLDGSPPCQGFSIANQNRLKKVAKVYDNGHSQVNEELFFEYVRILDGLKPKTFIAENVKGLTMGKAKKVLGDFEMDLFDDQSDTILHALMDCGYVVRWQVLNAADYGTPQNRLRVFFVGVRKDLKLEPSFPVKLGYQHSVLDALPHLANGEVMNRAGGITGWESADKDQPSPTIMSEMGRANPWKVFNGEAESFVNDSRGHKDSGCKTFIRQGSCGDFKDEGKEISQDKPLPAILSRNGGGKDQFKIGYGMGYAQSENGTFLRDVVETAEQPIRTISKMSGCGWGTNVTVTDGDKTRKFTIAELKRLGGFPDDFQISGSYSKQWEVIGNSVCPPQMFHLSRHVFETILSKIP